jgi:toxin-antitoxin system PIN domain toxin
VIIPDINLLLYAYNRGAPSHAASKLWWESALSGTENVGLPWVVSLGYVRLATSRRVLRDPWRPEEAVRHVGSWLQCQNVQVLQPGPRHVDILLAFAEAGVLSSDLVTDAHLAALAIEHQGVVYSNDADFARFPGLRHRNPLRE